MVSRATKPAWRRAAEWALSCVVVAPIFVTACVLGLVLHLDTPASRRVAARLATRALSRLFVGEVAIDGVARFGLRGVGGVSGHALDPSGVRVLRVSGVTVDIDTRKLVRSLLGGGPVVLDFTKSTIDAADVNLDASEGGELRLMQAFALKNPAPVEPEPRAPSPSSVSIEAPAIVVRHAWVHGQMRGAPLLDVDLDALALAVRYDGLRTHAALAQVDVAARGLPFGVDPKGRLSGTFDMPSPTNEAYAATAAFDGTLLGVASRARFSLDGQRVDATLDLADPDGQALRAFAPTSAFRQASTLHAEVSGSLPKLHAKARLTSGQAEVEATARLDLGDTLSANVEIAGRGIDLHAVHGAAPASSIGFTTQVNVVVPKHAEPQGTLRFASTPSTISSRQAPRIMIEGAFVGKTARLEANVDDRRMPTSLVIRTSPRGRSVVARVEARSRVQGLPELAALVGLRASGKVAMQAGGTLTLPEGSLDGSATFDGVGLSSGDAVVDEVHATFRIAGSLTAPIVDLEARADGAWVGARRIPSVALRGRVVRTPGALVLRGVTADLARHDVFVHANVDYMELRDPRVVVRGAEVQGVGAPVRLDLTREPDTVSAKIDAPSVDLAKVARILDLHELHAGRLGVTGAVTLGPNVAAGALHANLDELALGSIVGGRVRMDASLDGRRIGLGLVANLGDAGTLTLEAERLVIDGHPSRARAWRRASGSVRVKGVADLGKLSALLPSGTLPVDLSGRLSLSGTIARDDAEAPPEAHLTMNTAGLVVVGRPPVEGNVGETIVHRAPPFRLSGVDLGADVHVDGQTGHSELALRLTDARGLLAAFDGKALLPYAEFFTDPSRAVDKLGTTPLSMRLVVPRRALAKMPPIVGTNRIAGTVEADVDVSGTLLEPTVNVAILGKGIRDTSTRGRLAADMSLSATYDGAKAEVGFDVVHAQERLLAVHAELEARVRDALEGRRGAEFPWRASAKATVHRFDLGSIGQIADRRVRGLLSGSVVLDGLHEDAKVGARLTLDDFRIGRAEYPHGTISLDAGKDALDASIRIDQTDGFVALGLQTGLLWGSALAPKIDPARPVEAHLAAKSFRAAALLPFVRGVFNELDGRIEADARFAVDPRSMKTNIGGHIQFHDGVFQTTTFGDELRNATLTATFQPDGVIVIDGVRAESAQGKLTADGRIETKGLSVVKATGNLKIPESDPLDVVFDGQPLGQVSGTAHTEVRPTIDEHGEGSIAVSVDIPKLKLRLPRSLKVGVQELGYTENVEVGVFTDPSTFVRLRVAKEQEPDDAGGTRTDIDVTLGRIEVERGNQLRVTFTGHPHVTLEGDKTIVSGRVDLVRGTIDVQGKAFKVETGTLTFQPQDPSNPIVVATAAWDAGEGTRVFADFVGPVKSGKMTLRSEPSLPSNEILALVMFGSAGGTTGASGSASASGTAIGAGGGLATQGLTEALDDLAGIQATARIDTSRANNPRPELEVQVSPSVSVQVAHVLGNPPITDPDLNLATVDWRFRRNWSLETTIGDRGKAMVDAVWQKRY